MARRPTREALPRFIEPLLASPTRELPGHGAWVLQLERDGCRAQLIIDHGRRTLRTRRNAA